jgi:hypothetical protein
MSETQNTEDAQNRRDRAVEREIGAYCPSEGALLAYAETLVGSWWRKAWCWLACRDDQDVRMREISGKGTA